MRRQPGVRHQRISHWLVLCILLLGLLPPSRGQAQSAPPPVTQAAAATGDETPAANPPPTPAAAEQEPATAVGPVYLPLVLADPDPAAPPSPNGSWPRLGSGGSALLGTAPLTVTLQATLTPPPERASLADYRFSWSLGDGTSASGWEIAQRYPTPGVYTVTLTAYTGDVAFASLNEQVTVYDPARVTVGQVDQTGGRVLAREGDLWLDFAPGALPEPHTIFIRQLDLTQVTTDTVDGSPQLVVSDFGLPFHRVSLEAVRVRDRHAEYVVEFKVRPKGYTLHPHGVGDDDQLLETIQLWYAPQPGAARQPVRSWQLAYDVDQSGQWSVLRSVTVGGSDGGLSPALRLAYSWRRVDAWDGGRQGAGYTLSYAYDPVGNLTARSSAGQQLTYHYTGAQPHAVTAVAGDRYTYDANGTMITRSEDGVTYTQRWHPFNKLAQVCWQRERHQCNVQFVYDGDGNRLLKIDFQAGLEITTYDAGQMFEKQFNTTANWLGENVPTGASGNSYATCRGKIGGVTDYGYTGQRNETGFGLMDYNARYYRPRLGRFISPDSIVPDPTSGKGFNRYLYGNGNPLRFNDPTGHFSEEQLNWMGISKDKVETTVWNLLQKLEPTDRICRTVYTLCS